MEKASHLINQKIRCMLNLIVVKFYFDDTTIFSMNYYHNSDNKGIIIKLLFTQHSKLNETKRLTV